MRDGFQPADALLVRPKAKLTPTESILTHCCENHPEAGAGFSLGWDFDLSIEEEIDGFFIAPDDDINTEHAALFTQAVLKAFDLDVQIPILASHTCSRHEVGAYGGHACVITKDKIAWAGLLDFVEAEKRAHARGERYFACSQTTRINEYLFKEHYLMVCDVEADPEACHEYIFTNWRSDGEVIDGEAEYADGCFGSDAWMEEISSLEFERLKMFIPVTSVDQIAAQRDTPFIKPGATLTSNI